MSSSSEQQKMDIYPSLLPGFTIQDLEWMKDDEFWEFARQQAYTIPEPLSHAEYLECKLHSNVYLIALRNLAEVRPPPHRMARLPGMPFWMAGILAWRGETIAVIDLYLYFLTRREADSSRTTDGMLLIASQDERTFGLLVPAIGLTSTIDAEQITPLSVLTGFALAEMAEFIEGTYADLPILNIPALLNRLVQQIGTMINHG